jgi:hypothetical protein
MSNSPSYENERIFTGVWFPREIWEMKELSPLEKGMFAEIYAFDNGKGCSITNKHFIDFFHISEKKLQECFKHLESLALIHKKKDENGNGILICKRFC